MKKKFARTHVLLKWKGIEERISKPTGYVRLQAQGMDGEVELYSQNLPMSTSLSGLYVLFKRDGKTMKHLLCTIKVDSKGKGHAVKKIKIDNIDGAGLKIDDIASIAVMVPSAGYLFGYLNKPDGVRVDHSILQDVELSVEHSKSDDALDINNKSKTDKQSDDVMPVNNDFKAKSAISYKNPDFDIPAIGSDIMDGNLFNNEIPKKPTAPNGKNNTPSY